MKKQNIFTKEELADLGKLTVELIEASVDAGDKEKTKKLSRRMYKEFSSIHDLYRDWITALFTFIGRRYGDDVLHEALKETCTLWIRPLCEIYDKKDIRRKAELLAAGLRAHLQSLNIKEEEDKIVFESSPCGSGGRLVKDGAYDPPRNLLKIKKAQPMTFNRPDFPVYCAHCFFQNTLPKELHYETPFITEPAKKLGEEPCRIYIKK